MRYNKVAYIYSLKNGGSSSQILYYYYICIDCRLPLPALLGRASWLLCPVPMSQGVRGVVSAVVTGNSQLTGNSQTHIDALQDATLTMKDGSRFRGRVMNGMPLSGVMMYSDGSRYKGTFLHTSEASFFRHGKGTFTYPNGDEYEWTFVVGQIVGEGRFTVAADGTVFSGMFGLPAAEGGTAASTATPASPSSGSTSPKGYRGVDTAAGLQPVSEAEARQRPSSPPHYEHQWLLTGEGEIIWRPTAPLKAEKAEEAETEVEVEAEKDAEAEKEAQEDAGAQAEAEADENAKAEAEAEVGTPCASPLPASRGITGLGSRVFRGRFHRGKPADGCSCELNIETSSGARPDPRPSPAGRSSPGCRPARAAPPVAPALPITLSPRVRQPRSPQRASSRRGRRAPLPSCWVSPPSGAA